MATAAANEKAIQELKETTNVFRRLITGNGDGVGILESIRKIFDELETMNKRVGAIESDNKETRNMVREIVGYSGVRYDKDINPGRREADGKEEKEFLSYDWMKENVFPGLVEKIIVAIVTATFVLIITHWPL